MELCCHSSDCYHDLLWYCQDKRSMYAYTTHIQQHVSAQKSSLTRVHATNVQKIVGAHKSKLGAAFTAKQGRAFTQP